MFKIALLFVAAWFILGAVFYYGEKVFMKAPFYKTIMSMLDFNNDEEEEFEDPCMFADVDWEYKLAESGDHVVEIRRENGEWKCREFVECPDIIL